MKNTLDICNNHRMVIDLCVLMVKRCWGTADQAGDDVAMNVFLYPAAAVGLRFCNFSRAPRFVKRFGWRRCRPLFLSSYLPISLVALRV